MRSVGIILATFAVASILAVAGDLLMLRLFPASFDDQGVSHDARILAVMLAYTIVLYCLGGYMVAALASNAKRGQALIFGIVLLAVVAVTTWIDYHTAPRWYHIANLLSPVPAAVFGGRIRARQ